MNYMRQLDSLRALAVIAVMGAHWLPKEYQFGFAWGDIGVQLFFVLSGFLITRILLNCRQHGQIKSTLWAFYVRRFLRIFPLFYAVLMLAYVFNIGPVRDTLAWHVTYLSNIYIFVRGDWHGPISHFWSLAVEEQFYLFWPIVVLLVPDRYLRHAIIGLIAVGLLSRILLPTVFPTTQLWMVLPNFNFTALGVGALLAYSNTVTKLQRFSDLHGYVLLILLLVYCLMVVVVNTGLNQIFIQVTQHIVMLAIFMLTISACVSGVGGHIGRLLSLPPLVYLGKISYGVYVLHNFAGIVVNIIVNKLGFEPLDDGVVKLMAMAVVTILGASLSWHCFESPINSLKRYFQYVRRF